MKNCSKCKKLKSMTPTEFSPDKRAKDGFSSACRDCCRKANNNSRMLREYGISLKDKDVLLAAQNNICPICQKPNPIDTDHDHKTGKVRGILHKHCNKALGLLGDDVETIIRAASYVATGGVA